VIRTLIADDEAPARARLRQLLAAHPDIEIAGEAATGIQAMELSKQLGPDLLLLDVQMPGCTGIDVAACLAAPRPHIVFCTAFEEHAVDAFELAAVDYLLKPVSRARLAQALERVRSLGGRRKEELLDEAVRSHRNRPTRFLVKHGEGYVVVGESCVLFFASEGGLTRLISDAERHWMEPTLNELEQRLDPARFFRVSRAALINLSAVKELHPLPGGSGEVLMKNGQKLEVSRRRFRDLLQALEGVS
jgi:two-component system, LytTR family, response regulator